MTGIRAPIASSMMRSVSSARESTDVYARSNRNPLSNSPARRASAMPFSVSGTSTQPVNRFSRFQSDWPWRTRTRGGMGRASTQRLRDAQASPSLVVRSTAQDLECPVELLQHDHARQPVRERERREAPDEPRRFPHGGSEPLVSADAQRQRLRRIAQLSYPLGELHRAQSGPALVDGPEVSADLPQQRFRFAQRSFRAQLEQFQLRAAANPFRVLLRQLRGGSLVLAHRKQADLHSTSMRGASAQSPSRS